MAVNLALTLTSDGKGAFWNSRSTGISLDITYIQFGSLNRLTTGEESSLGLPKQYTQIQNGSKIGVDQVRIMATMPGLENYNVAEIGLWSGVPNQAGSILVAYISVATGFIAQMVSGIDLVFTYDMVVSTIDIDYVNIVKDTDQSSTFSLLAIHESDRNAHPYYLTTDTEQTISGAKTFSNKAIFSGGLSGELTGNASTATALKTARNVGGVSFNGTANINLPGVNETGNQNTTGNAATATKLLTARKFNGISFDGTKDITVADDTKLPLSGGTVNGTLIASKLEILNLNQAIANGDNYTITYDYATRLAHIQMRVFTNQPIYLGLPYSGSDTSLNLRDVTLPITLRKRIYTQAFFTTVSAVGVGQMGEAYEWHWWTPPPGIDGATDSKVRISAKRWMGSADEACHCDLYVTGYF